MNRLLIFALMGASLAASAADIAVSSPDGCTTLRLDDNSRILHYSVERDGATYLKPSPLGLRSDIGDFTQGMRIINSDTTDVRKTYRQDRIKHSEATYSARRLKAYALNPKGDTLGVEFSVADNDVAFRYLIPRAHGGETGAILISSEASGFALPEGSTAFVTPQSDVMTGWKRSKPSYEEVYMVDVPVGTPSQYGHGFTFPALFRTPAGGWVLLGETGVDSRYVGSHISDASADGVYTIAFPMKGENNGSGGTEAAMSLPAETPWRTITIGDNLAPIVETTVTWDLVEPLYEATVPARPAKGMWSWILWQDNSINYDDQKTFIDFAAEMGYDHVLIDAAWDVNIGREGIEKLVEYARGKGVDVLLWYSSSGWWNDIVQSPVNVMCRAIERKKAMKWMKQIGVKGIKVDFFGGDKQETMRLYEDILSDANDYGISVIFHGCTMPRGWERMYPNYVGSEAVLASENMIFSQWFNDEVEQVHATLHPFIRNTLGSMEFGGSFLNKRLSRDNASGPIRRSTDAFQLATAVLYQNAVQNFALAPNNLTDAPAEALDFMKAVPTSWDETRYIDGYPGRYAVIARRHGDTWYIAGISNLMEPLELKLDMPMLRKGDTATVICDADAEGTLVRRELKVKRPGEVRLTLQPKGGFIIVK